MIEEGICLILKWTSEQLKMEVTILVDRREDGGYHNSLSYY